MTTQLTNREQAFMELCLSGSDERAAAIEKCRSVMGRPLITVPTERANVAAELAAQGFDGIGRVELGLGDLNAAAKSDESLPVEVRG